MEMSHCDILKPMSPSQNHWKYMIVVAAFAAYGFSCKDRASKEDCKKLLDHVIEIHAQAAGVDTKGSKEVQEEISRQKKKVRDYLNKDVMEQCQNSRSANYVACALRANNLESLASCDAQ